MCNSEEEMYLTTNNLNLLQELDAIWRDFNLLADAKTPARHARRTGPRMFEATFWHWHFLKCTMS